MRVIDQYTLLHDACSRIRLIAAKGIWDGTRETPYFVSCKWQLLAYDCTIIYTKEEGYHSGGWWKNPDYERCWHLSIAFYGAKNKNTLAKILHLLFDNKVHLLWVEPPYTDEGKSKDVWHYRLFCDEHWQPIKPRGEVYNTEFTERGWKSYSELHSKK